MKIVGFRHAKRMLGAFPGGYAVFAFDAPYEGADDVTMDLDTTWPEFKSEAAEVFAERFGDQSHASAVLRYIEVHG